MTTSKAGSFLTSLGVIRATAEITAGTLFDLALGEVTRVATDRRVAWWGAETERIAHIDLRVRGAEHVAGEERFVVMSNHQSHVDIPVLFRAVSPSIRMVTKKELFRVPAWGRAMRAAGFIEIDRKDRARAKESLERARQAMTELGVHVWIAPEGTRSRTGSLGPFKKGGFILASQSGARILPVGLWGTRDVLPPGGLRARKGARVGVVIGAPIDSAGRDKDALLDETRAAIAKLVDEAKALSAT